MAKQTQGTIDLTLGVNTELQSLTVETGKFSKAVQKHMEKVGPVEVDVPVKLHKASITRFQNEAQRLTTSLQAALKKSTGSMDLSIGITNAIKQELRQSNDLLKDGKIMKSGIVDFIHKTANVTKTEAKKALSQGGLFEQLAGLEGKNKGQATSILTTISKQLEADKAKVVQDYKQALAAVQVGESQLRNLTSGVSGKTQEAAGHIKALAEAMELIRNPGKSQLAKGLATDIDLVTQRVNTLKNGLTAVAALSAQAVNNPEAAFKAGVTPDELVRKTAEISAALKQERAELKALAKEQSNAASSTEKLAQAREKLKQSVTARESYAGKEEETKLRLLKEQYAASIALDRLEGKGVSKRTDDLNRLIIEATKNTNELTKAQRAQKGVLEDLTSKQKQYQAALKEINAGGPDLTLSRYRELIKVVDDYGKSIHNASKVQSTYGKGNQQLDGLISGYSKLSNYIREATEQQAKFNDAQRRYSVALGPKDQLIAANEMSKAVTGMAEAQRRAGAATPRSLAGLQAQKDTVESLVQQAKELTIANNQAASSYNSLNGVMRSFFRYAVEFALLYKVQQGVVAMVTSVVQLQDALKATQAISRSTDAEMQKVSASVQQVAIDTEYSTNEIAQAAQMLAQAGVDIREVGSALEYVALAASATNSSIATTTDIMTTMSNVFKDMTFQEIADQMTATINLSKLTGEELSTILSRAVEVSETFNIIPEQMNAAFAVLRNAGIKASTISTGYRQALLEVFSPDEKTLKFLEKRYTELGQHMSQGTIAAMFQGFARAEDPIRAVTEELEKLGYGTSQAAEFTRVFDVRATNVLDVLVKQRDEYIKLTTQIDNHGAALKGNQTQMESLSKSFNNLGSIITVVANDAFGGALGSLEKIIDALGDIIQLSGKAMNALKEQTGSSGAGNSILSGVLGGFGQYAKTGSIAGALTKGVGVAAGTEALQIGANAAGSSVLSEVLGAASVVLSATGLFSKKGGLRAGGVNETPKEPSKYQQTKFDPKSFGNKMGGVNTEAAAQLASSGMQMVAVLVGWFKNLPKIFMGLGPAGWIATAGGLLFTAVQLLSKDTSAQIDAIRSRVEAASKKVKKVEGDIEGDRKDAQLIEDLTASVANAKTNLGTFFRTSADGLNLTNDQIVEAVGVLDGVSFDLGSSGLAEGLRELQDRLKTIFPPTLDQRDIIEEINKTRAEVDKVDGNRAAWQQRLLEAYETSDSDRTEQQKSLLAAFGKLNAEEKASVNTQIRNLNQAGKFNELSGRLREGSNAGLQTELAKQTGAVKSGGQDIAKLEVSKAINSKEGLGGISKLVLQAGKDNNVQLLSDLRDAIVAIKPVEDPLAKAITPGKTGIASGDKASALQFLDATQAASAKASSDEMTANLATLAKETSAQVDHFRDALNPEQVQALGIPISAVQQAQKATTDFLADVPEAWKVAYTNAIGMGRSTSESISYLKQSSSILGDFPPALEKEYQTLLKRDIVEKANLQAAADSTAALKDQFEIGESIRDKMKAVERGIAETRPNAAAGDPAAIAKLKQLTDEQISLQEENNTFNRDYQKALADNKNKQAGAGTPIIDADTSKARVNDTYQNLENINKKSASERLLLENERTRLSEQDNQGRIKALGLNSKIYDLRVREAKNIEDSAKESLLRSSELTKYMGHTAKSYEEIAAWFNSSSGQDFLKNHEVESIHLAKLTEAVKDQELARRELSQRILEEGTAIDARLARDTSALDVKTQQATRALDKSSGRDQAGDSKKETQVLLDSIKARQDLELKASDEKLALYEEQTKAGRISQLELTQVTQTELAKQLQSRKDFLSQALAEEKKHIDNIRNLKQSQKDNAKSEQDFKTGIYKQDLINQGDLNPADALQFDRQVVGGKFQQSLATLDSGDKVNGLNDMNAAIAEQQRVVTELQKAEAEGVANIGDTSVAYQDLLFMYDARRQATDEQIAKEEAAKKAATDSANAQLQAINSLIEALNTLADRLATMPTLDLGVGTGAEVPQVQEGEPPAKSERTTGVTGINSPLDLRYETNVDEQGRVSYSKAKKYAEGGRVTGPGTTTSDSVPVQASLDEFIIPAKAAKELGYPFLEVLRKGLPDINTSLAEILPNKVLANMMSPNAADKQESLQPTIFQLGDASIQTKAQPSAVQEFQAALRVQAIKKGRRV